MGDREPEPTPDELAEQVRRLDVGTFLLSFSATLTSLGYARCGRTLHQSCVCSVIERVR